jgi:catechol 2,3-dioxygenase-like lactoylglutathione lyase family enzyme
MSGMTAPSIMSLFLIAVSGLHAQLPAPNPAGVGMGHLHMNTTDLDASRKFWVDVLGATPVKFGSSEVYKFPDVLVFVARKPAVSGGTEGSSVNHLGFKVQSLKEFVAKAKAAGFRVPDNRPSPTQAFLFGPEDVKVELSEEPSMSVPIAHHHIHFSTPAVADTKAWYAKTFDAVPGKRGRFEAADVPGANLSFSPASGAAPVGTKGRALDHIGFEVKDLEAFTKKLEAAGVKFDIPYRKVGALAIAFFTDPWGTYIELTEGLNRL